MMSGNPDDGELAAMMVICHFVVRCRKAQLKKREEERRQTEENWQRLLQQCRDWLSGNRSDDGLQHLLEWAKRTHNFDALGPDKLRKVLDRLRPLDG